ncbi:MAG: hypothetical protein HOI80_01550 [Alphaproteobacteria bacterium]|jgi:hypothetical protein|nr:hypothetical protein [Alphaproteobacteria bacterium]MBT5389892.1 hypothetical protein [Alphaproteobacteria bacterium]MBT5654169.1 hypothetical protein [Alphaproteobacteria bacterium]
MFKVNYLKICRILGCLFLSLVSIENQAMGMKNDDFFIDTTPNSARNTYIKNDSYIVTHKRKEISGREQGKEEQSTSVTEKAPIKKKTKRVDSSEGVQTEEDEHSEKPIDNDLTTSDILTVIPNYNILEKQF